MTGPHERGTTARVTGPSARTRGVRALGLPSFEGGWIWAALGLPGADAFVGLFTTQLTDQSVGSIPALGIGSLCAFVVGGTFGVLIAPCYNLAGRVLGE